MSDPELTAELQALQDLALKHRREFIRLRTIHLARLTGTEPRFSRNRLTQAELAELPPVTDANGNELAPGQRVLCPDGLRAKVERVDRRSRRCVVHRSDGSRKMVVSRRLTVLDRRQLAQAS